MAEMTCREVRNKFIQNLLDDVPCCISTTEEAKLVFNAIEKQIPKEPYFEGDSEDEYGDIIYDTWVCSYCEKHYEVDYEKYKFCPNCGQAIDWEE